MADTTFNCPHCQQPIQCDDQWAGQQIQCPLCQGALVVPQAAGAPAPTKSAGQSSLGKQLVDVPGSTKLAFQQNAQKPATAERNIPIRNLAPPAKKKQSPVVKLAIWAGVLVVVGAGAYFGWGYYEQWQEKKASAAETAKKTAAAPGAAQPGDAVAGTAVAPGTGTPAAAPGGPLPVVPPVYNLDITQAKVPEGNVNGVITGSNFVAEVARVDAVGPAQVLRLTQGQPTQPDREILVYLHLKSGDKLSGHTWTISSDMKGPDVPQVIKRWKVRAGFAPALKPYSSGYAMKLELGQLTNGTLPGKIYVALPDNEQSVAGGVFNATTTLPDVIGAVALPPGTPPPPPPGTAPAPRTGADRYGAPARR